MPVHVFIDGQRRQLLSPSTVLAALDEAGVAVPALCHDSRLKPCGACRLCLVDVEGHPRPVAACLTAVEDGMRIQARTPELDEHRRLTLAVLAADHPPAATPPVASKPFSQWLSHYGIEAPPQTGASNIDDSLPHFQYDPSQCIDCYRCVRICDEVQGQSVWSVRNRGDRTQIVAGAGGPLSESTCVSCGACVDTCPTGALLDKSALLHPQPSSWTRTTCPYCGTGCELEAGVHANQLVAIRPVPDAPVSRGHLCSKGRYAFEYVHASDRVTQPMIRRRDGARGQGAEWQKVTWDEALAFAATRLRRIVAERGPDHIGVLGSARATNEENYLAQKFARAVIGTNNVDCCARVCHAPTAAAMSESLGTGAATNSFDDIEKAALILVWGANATANHPIVGARIRQAKRNGALLIVADPRKTELAAVADVHLQLRPGTDIALLNAMAQVIVSEELADKTFLASRAAGLEEFAAFLAGASPENAAAHCGIGAETIRRAARLYATSRPALSVHGLGVTEHTQGTDGVACLVNLALLTGNLGKPGAGVNPLRGQNNVQGAAHMGCEPDHYAGYRLTAGNEPFFEAAWAAPLPRTKGMNLLAMLDAAGDGRLAALWAIGYDVLMTNAHTASTRAAMAKLELVIVQDMFLNETAREFGDVFFPAASSFEKDGTFMNAERRVQRVRKAIDPPGAALPDWEIVCRMARAMGHPAGFEFGHPEQIWNEVRSVWPAGAGIAYARLEHGGLQWPCPDETHPGTPILHAAGFPSGRRAPLRTVAWIPSPEQCSAEFPLLLGTGRSIYQFNAGTMTMRSANRLLRPADTLDLAPADADRFGIAEGDAVRILSRYGAARLTARITTEVRPGEAFATFQDSDTGLNHVTAPFRDPLTGTPAYKLTAIRVEKISAAQGGTS